MYLCTLCGTRPKKYPLNSKLPCFPNSPSPRNSVSFKLASYASSRRLPLRGCLPKSRTTYCPRDMIVLGLIFFSGAKVALQFPCAGPRSVPFFAAPPATSDMVGLPAGHRHVANAKTAVTSIYLHLLANPTGDPPDFNVGRLE